MSKEKLHIDDQFIPEGLEFREEYMHAALESYSKHKRIILWKQLSVAAAILLLLAGGAIGLTRLYQREIVELEKTDSGIEQRQEGKTNDSSSTIDLESDEGTIEKHRPSPAVESLEATQDRSSKAVDMGDPMSSGVGLPGQLSNSSSNVSRIAENISAITLASTPRPANIVEKASKANNHQPTEEETQINQVEVISESLLPIAYLPADAIHADLFLHPNRPIQLPYSKWSVYARLGMKLWADYAFNQSIQPIDGMAGLEANYRINGRFSASMQGQFFTISGKATPYTVVQRQYGEGFAETSYRYFTDRMYYTGVSAGINYRIAPGHSVGAGWYSSYLLTADNRIETGTASSFENPTSQTRNAKGYVSGYQSLQHSLLLQYEYSLGKYKSIGLQYNQGLTDITKAPYFGSEIHKNSALTCYLKFKLTR